MLLASTVVAAQDTGTLIQRSPAQVDYQDKNAARLLTNRWAKCVVEHGTGRVEAYLSLPLGSKASIKMRRAFLSGESECLSSSIESRELFVADQVTRGALFEALYMRRFSRNETADLSALAPLTYDWPAGSEVTAEAQQTTALARVGDCMVHKNPSGARLLMHSAPGSFGEAQAMGAIIPLLGSCLPNGKQYQFSKSLLRGVVAEPLYRLSERAADGN